MLSRFSVNVKHHHGIVVAYHISTQLVPANKTNITLEALAGINPPVPPDQAFTDADRLYNATVANSYIV
ncbi:hypothetical protein PG984_005571 [Apiospora sp. TS-2023a]